MKTRPKGQRWIHQVNQTSGNQVHQVENETIHFEQRIETQMMRETKSGEETGIVDNESTLHQIKKRQDQQQVTNETNEVKRVIKLDKAGSMRVDTAGQDILDKMFKGMMDEQLKEQLKSQHAIDEQKERIEVLRKAADEQLKDTREVSVETKKEEFIH